MKSKTVWVVNCGDTGCDEPGYIAVAKVFAKRADAQTCIEACVAEDCKFFNLEARWSDDRTVAVIERDDGRVIGYTLDEMAVL